MARGGDAGRVGGVGSFGGREKRRRERKNEKKIELLIILPLKKRFLSFFALSSLSRSHHTLRHNGFPLRLRGRALQAHRREHEASRRAGRRGSEMSDLRVASIDVWSETKNDVEKNRCRFPLSLFGQCDLSSLGQVDTRDRQSRRSIVSATRTARSENPKCFESGATSS